MKKRLLIVCIAVLLVVGLLCGIMYSRADSGFDSSWDSGSSWSSSSSWDSGSSWSSSSSWDNDYSSDYSSDSGYSSSSTFSSGQAVFALINTIIIIIIVVKIVKGKSNSVSLFPMPVDNYLITDEMIRQLFNMSKDELRICLFSLYKNIQIAWMNFDYESLEKLTTNELYNQYKMQLDILKIKNQQNVMKDFCLNAVSFNDIKTEYGVTTINCFMQVNMIDYLEENGKAIRGSSSKPIYITYEMDFIMNEKDYKCPSCGADVSNEIDICPNCKSKLVKIPNKIVLSKKKNIDQR